MRINFFCFAAMGFALIASSLNADVISVNFHVGDDADDQAAHVFDGVETAGVGAFNTSSWNNVNVGSGGANNTAGSIFSSPTTLFDDMGDASAASLSQSVNSTSFVGYAANSAASATELGNGITDDNLFNSYLALNGPSGDGSPADAAVLQVSGLGANFTSNGYDLIIYSDSDRRGNGSAVRQSSFTVVPTGGTAVVANVQDDEAAVAGTATPTFDGTYVLSSNSAASVNEYSNYTIISGLTASGFDLEVTSPDGGRGAISGFQIVAAVPEPGSLIALGMFGLGIAARRRRS